MEGEIFGYQLQTVENNRVQRQYSRITDDRFETYLSVGRGQISRRWQHFEHIDKGVCVYVRSRKLEERGTNHLSIKRISLRETVSRLITVDQGR